MSHGPEHQIEHAEHATHAAHNSFDRQVTISIAIIAAVLACVTMVGHRAHNDVLRLQGEALQEQLQSSIENSQASNRWAQYQALNIRDHFYRSILEQSEASNTNEAARKRWQSQVTKYETELPKTKELAEKYTDEGKKAQERATERLQVSHQIHARADRFDLGELGLQLGVVLCSLAILTKQRFFWIAGLLCSLVGAGLAVTGYFGLLMEHPEKHGDTHAHAPGSPTAIVSRSSDGSAA